MPLLNKRWLTFFTFCAAVLLSSVFVVGFFSFKEGTYNKTKFNAYGVDLDSTNNLNLETNWTSSKYALALILNIDAFDPSKGGSTALHFHIDYYPINSLATDNNAPAVPVRLLLQSTTVDFKAGTVMATQSVKRVLDGDVNRYPFDVFTANYTISATTNPTQTSYGTPLPITAYVQGAIQGFKIDTVFRGLSEDGSGVQLAFTVRRSPITKTFSILILTVMWCLSSGVFVAAMSVWFRDKKVELQLISLSTAMLFALPKVRDSQPGIPAVAGTTSDMVGFFWNILLVAVSSFCLIINYIVKYRRERPVPAPLFLSL